MRMLREFQRLPVALQLCNRVQRRIRLAVKLRKASRDETASLIFFP
jgi:hypothetical protein